MSELPEDMQSGLIPTAKRSPLGEVTVNSMSIDSLSWHLILVLVAVGGAYLVNSYLKVLFPAVSFPVYGLALLCSIAVQFILKLVKLDGYVDKPTITHIGSSSTDFLVAFGVASINITVVLQYAIPIILLAIIGFVFVVAWFLLISPRFFRSYWFERGLYIFGMSTGVLATGVILLRIADPDFKTGVLEDFGFAWIFLSIVDMIIVSLSPMFVVNGLGVMFGLILLGISVVMLMMCRRILGNLQNPL